MPGGDGYDLVRRVRVLPADRGGRPPALAPTADARASDRVWAIEAGFSAHLAEPVTAAELVDNVAMLAAVAAGRGRSTAVRGR